MKNCKIEDYINPIRTIFQVGIKTKNRLATDHVPVYYSKDDRGRDGALSLIRWNIVLMLIKLNIAYFLKVRELFDHDQITLEQHPSSCQFYLCSWVLVGYLTSDCHLQERFVTSWIYPSWRRSCSRILFCEWRKCNRRTYKQGHVSWGVSKWKWNMLKIKIWFSGWWCCGCVRGEFNHS